MPDENQPTYEKQPVNEKRSANENQPVVRKRSAAEKQPAIEQQEAIGKRSTGRRFSTFGALQDDYKRDIIFAYVDAQGGETSYREPAIAKFDTGCEGYNLLSKDFLDAALEGNLGHFEPLNDFPGEHIKSADEYGPDNYRSRGGRKNSFWTSCKRQLARSYRKLRKRTLPPLLVTLDNQPIKVVGILRNTRWRGLNLDQSIGGQMIRFPDKFFRSPPYNEFQVVENLKYDVVFGLPTINHLQQMFHTGPLTPSVVAGVLVNRPNHATASRRKHLSYKRVRPGFLGRAPSDSADRKQQQREKKEQELLLRAQE